MATFWLPEVVGKDIVQATHALSTGCSQRWWWKWWFGRYSLSRVTWDSWYGYPLTISEDCPVDIQEVYFGSTLLKKYLNPPESFSHGWNNQLSDFYSFPQLFWKENPLLVRALNTHNRLVCIDGRFPHWVSGYTGERCSEKRETCSFVYQKW